MDNNKQNLTTDELSTIPLDHNWYQKLAVNFEIIQRYLDKIDADDLKNKFDDMSEQLNVCETNTQAIVNILSNYDVPIQIVNGKVVDTEEGK
ncbi:hypothetical protein [Lactiplantibacillus argentoratensis]|uniref:Uncharacterized protein n=2 Tax=Lactiplantibacillus argentoratensis TaxID=271881 RepID=A0AAN1Q1P2_9LACO|nr:hypothetical protein [Lactiplantibacillus argentoratensis]KRL90091.1 hypothetical protein FD10_GL001743 [Lactiplantibacillus argentoratensis DSM 16365]AYJ36039.1 hypothetical protein LPA65_09805 [Lactiplantibacillus argentoratensis]AYJ36086.1 hypothetical protein LPA65_10120 [Lactiplantibacillus argentoratensis]AYJ36139.1 hypothetical protein LPA65_10435 [Lactiplantibacillus argentoratensis]GEO53937.1 hypothetical protein LPL03_20330 [Lactiplantibacillus argentoratensis]